MTLTFPLIIVLIIVTEINLAYLCKFGYYIIDYDDILFHCDFLVYFLHFMSLPGRMPTEHVEDHPTTYEIVMQGSRQNRMKLVDSEGYGYTLLVGGRKTAGMAMQC